MSQQIQGYGNNPYAEEALRLAEIGRGQEGMSRTTAPIGPNLQDSGGMSKPSVNAQPFNNERLLMQNMSENAKTSVPQAQAGAIGAQRAAVAEVSGQEAKAKEFAATRVAEMLYANDAGTATFALAAPEVAKKVAADVATQKIMASGMNPQVPFTSNRFAA